MSENKLYIQYGCGPFSAPAGWKNYDASPTLRLQQLPVIGKLLKSGMHVTFHEDVLLGDIRKGLPRIAANSCDGIYCSHVLEHLSYEDCRLAVKNTWQLLKSGGYFRCVVPDLESASRRYLENLGSNDQEANVKFLEETMLGKLKRPSGFKQLMQHAFGNREHLYMWDRISLAHVLKEAGFSSVRSCNYHDCPDHMFHLVEEETRFNNAVALEAIK